MANDGSTTNFAGGGTVTWNDIEQKPEYFPTQWGDIDNIPPVSPPDWSEVTGKPTSFPPAEHANEAHNPDYIDVNTPIASTITIPHTWVTPNAVTVPSGTTDAIPPMLVTIPTGKTAKLLSVRYGILGGTSATFKLQRNGADMTGYTGLSATTTPAQTDQADVSLANGDKLQPIVTAVSGSPVGLSVSIVIEYGG